MMNEGDLVGANNRFTQMVVDAPLFAEAWNKRATVRFLLGDNAGSKSDIIKVIELEPRHFGALSGLGMIHLEEGNLQSAVQAYEAALAINPHMDNLRVIVERLNQQLKGQAL
jgi:tetratricopeptide (TPR) repeat protein